MSVVPVGGDRARRVLWLVAEHGVRDTQQVSVLLGVSRPTAHRVLDGLVRAGLLQRRRPVRNRLRPWLAGSESMSGVMQGCC